MVVSNQIMISGGDASVTDGPIGCTLRAEGHHLGSFCAAVSGCAMLLKQRHLVTWMMVHHLCLLPLDCMGLIHCMLCNRQLGPLVLLESVLQRLATLTSVDLWGTFHISITYVSHYVLS